MSKTLFKRGKLYRYGPDPLNWNKKEYICVLSNENAVNFQRVDDPTGYVHRYYPYSSEAQSWYLSPNNKPVRKINHWK